jgi:hypothetical protein
MENKVISLENTCLTNFGLNPDKFDLISKMKDMDDNLLKTQLLNTIFPYIHFHYSKIKEIVKQRKSDELSDILLRVMLIFQNQLSQNNKLIIGVTEIILKDILPGHIVDEKTKKNVENLIDFIVYSYSCVSDPNFDKCTQMHKELCVIAKDLYGSLYSPNRNNLDTIFKCQMFFTKNYIFYNFFVHDYSHLCNKLRSVEVDTLKECFRYLELSQNFDTHMTNFFPV